MPWPMLIAAGAQIGSQLIKSAQNRRGRSMREDSRAQGDAAFRNNYDRASRQGQQAAQNAAMHQQMSLARGSGTAGSQAAGVAAAIQNAPSIAANAALAGARIGEGYAAGANQYQGSTLNAMAAGNDVQSGYENSIAGAAGMGGMALAGAFGGGGGQQQAPQMGVQGPPIQAPGYATKTPAAGLSPDITPGMDPSQMNDAEFDRPGSDERMKTNVTPMSATGTPTMQELERIQREQMAGFGAPREQLAQNTTLQAERLRAMRDMERASFAAPKPVTSTPSWLMPQAPTINATTQEEGALGYQSESPYTRSVSYSTSGSQYANASPAGPQGQPRNPSLPGTPAPQQAPQQNRPVVPFRHQISHSGVNLSMLTPEQQQSFYAQNPDFAPRGDGQSVRSGRPEHGLGGMQGPEGPPDQVYYDPEQRDFSGDFVPWVNDRQLAGQLSSQSLGGQGIQNTAPYADQPNAYSNRIQGSGGGFKTGIGYTSTGEVPGSYRQMVRDGRIEGMVRVPILDFTRRTSLRGGGGAERGGMGGDGGISDDAQLEALAERRAFDRAVESAAAEKEAYDFVRRNEATSPEEANELLSLANATEASRTGGGVAGGPARKSAPSGKASASFLTSKPKPSADDVMKSIVEYSKPPPAPKIEIGEAEIEGAMSEEPEKTAAPKEKLSSNADDVVPYTYKEMLDFAKDELLNPGKWGDIKKVQLDDLDAKTRAAVEKRVAELMTKQQQALAEVPPDKIGSDERAKNSGGKMSAMDVFRKTPGYSYEYKHGMMGAPGTAPGKHFGPMAQDLEKTPAGKSVVKPGPDGMKRVDTSRLALLQSAALHDIVKRLDKMEKRRA